MIDAHLHLDEKIPGPAAEAVSVLDYELQENDIEWGVVLHLRSQRWPRNEVAKAIGESARLTAFANIDPFGRNIIVDIDKAINDEGFIGIKMHPRLEIYDVVTEKSIALIRAAGDAGVPVLIDAFPDGTALMSGFNAVSFAKVAKECPDTRIILAHMGGHHVIDLMMLAKRLPNVFFDLSYSLLYYRGSSVESDILYACKSMKYDRVFYGSDYPDRSIRETLNSSLELFSDVSKENVEKIFHSNAKKFFSKKEDGAS